MLWGCACLERKIYFNCVRKEHVGGVGEEFLDGDLLDAQDEGTGGEVLADYGALLGVLVVGEYSLFGWLDDDLDILVVLEDLLHMLWSKGRSPLPDALVLATDAHFVDFGLHRFTQNQLL